MKISTPMKAVIAIMALALLASGTRVALGFFSPPASPPQQTAGITFGDAAFKSTWERTDLPVQNAKASRSWLWGPTSIFSGNEPWAESPGGQHLVQYFDKSRMEVNDPNADRNSQWFVTNGLLVVEMMTGKIAIGNNAVNQKQAAQIPVAGDPSTSVNAPTYASAAKVASLEGNNRASNRTGQPVNQILDRAGNVTAASKTQDQVVNVTYESTLGHNIPNVFWSFMNQTGVVYQNGQYVTDKVFDWVFAMGYPLTEPYWIQISVGGKDTWVVMQAYQRRILTFNPNNDPNFQVEMGNVGQAYYNYRYNQQGGPLPSATAAAGPSVKLNPSEGPSNTTVGVSGTGYGAYAAVVINVAAQAIAYNQSVATIAADAAGNFSAYINLPGEVATQPNVQITATGANGSPALSQQFTITHSPTLAAAPMEVTSKGVVKLQGGGFTANTDLTVSAYQVGKSGATASGHVKTDASGAFQTTYQLVGKAPVGAQYTVEATGPNNLKAQAAGNILIVPQPSAHVNPSSGPANANVAFSGSSWQPNRVISIELEGDNGQTEVYQSTNPVVSDGSGNFSTNVLIPQAYAGQSQVMVRASDHVNGLTMSAPYILVNPTPPAANPKLSIVPNPIVSNQKVQVYGSGYPAGQIVSVAVGVVGGALGPAASASADGQGNFNASFSLPSSLAGAGMVTIAATSTNGTNSSMNVTVINASAGPTPPPAPGPSGLPMSVRLTYYGGPATVKVSGTGWPAGQSLTAFVIASDNSVNQTVATGAVKSDGSFQLSFDEQSSWADRTNMGVKVVAATGANSVRYLPTTSMTNGGSGSYTFTGANWSPSTKILIFIEPKSGSKTQVATANTNGSGVFQINVVTPSSAKGNIDTFELEAQGQPYTASFTP